MQENKKCLIIINKLSGHYSNVDENMLKTVFGKGYDIQINYIDEKRVFPYAEADRVVVCGGDGTLNSAINKYKGKNVELIYCPYGTLNEFSRQANENGFFEVKDCGTFNDTLFSYVLATGTFTPLGYAVEDSIKQKYKALAYVVNVLKQLHVWRINAKMTVNGQNKSGEYCLIMVINSKNCFGLSFNKMHKPNDGKLFLLTVKAPKRNGLIGLFSMFFPFFRAFFVGFKKEYTSKRMSFSQIENMTLELDKKTDFCVDGERYPLEGELNIKNTELKPSVKLYTVKGLKKQYKQSN